METTQKHQCSLLCSNTMNMRDNSGNFLLQPLPYESNMLEPFISEKTIKFHYGKHLAGYIENTNRLKKDTQFADMTIQQIIRQSDGALFNNASQVFNHYFQFEELCPPNSGQNSSSELQKELENQFGNFDKFKEMFSNAAISLFGSGYAWLVQDKTGKMEIIQTQNAGSPIKESKRPLLNLDVWEHAYYLDVQNSRGKYIENFWNIVNWDVVNRRFDRK